MAASENSPPTGRISWPPTAGRRAALAQSAERFTRNEQVVGSIPTGGSEKSQLDIMIFRLVGHGAELGSQTGSHVRRRVRSLVVMAQARRRGHGEDAIYWDDSKRRWYGSESLGFGARCLANPRPTSRTS